MNWILLWLSNVVLYLSSVWSRIGRSLSHTAFSFLLRVTQISFWSVLLVRVSRWIYVVHVYLFLLAISIDGLFVHSFDRLSSEFHFRVYFYFIRFYKLLQMLLSSLSSRQLSILLGGTLFFLRSDKIGCARKLRTRAHTHTVEIIMWSREEQKEQIIKTKINIM